MSLIIRKVPQENVKKTVFIDGFSKKNILYDLLRELFHNKKK